MKARPMSRCLRFSPHSHHDAAVPPPGDLPAQDRGMWQFPVAGQACFMQRTGW